MAEALYASGGSYDAAEDRKLIRAIFRAGTTGGVISGMGLSVGTGLNVSIDPGYFVVNDTTSGAYLGYITATETVPISVNTTGTTRVDTIYVTVNATTGVLTFGKATGSSVIPASSTKLGTVTVPNNAVAFTLANLASTPNPVNIGGFVEEKYLRNDTPDTLYPGTNAYAPTAANNVANKSYVDTVIAANKAYVDNTVAANTGFVNLFGQGATHFLIQAGTSVSNANADSNSSVTFPARFPRGIVTVVTSGGDDGANPGWSFNPFDIEPWGFSYRVWDRFGNPQRGSIHRVNWIAIGY